MKKIFNTTVSVKDGSSRSVLKGIVQHDTLNEVNIRLTDGSRPFDYTGYTNIILKALKADGTSYIDSEGNSVIATNPVGGLITVILKGQATAAVGLCQCVIEIYADGEKMTSARLNYEVTDSLGTGEDVASESQYPAFQKLLSDLSKIEADATAAGGYATRAEIAANKAELWAKASQDVSEGDFATRAELEVLSGIGWGNRMSEVSAGANNEAYETYCQKLDEALAKMVNLSAKQISAYPPELWGLGRGTATLFKTNDLYATLCGVLHDDTCYGFRIIKINGAWRKMEWVNPPMMPGVEYRTTERCEGKPVYVQRVNVGALPASGSAHAYINVKDQAIIRVVRENFIVRQETETRGTYSGLPLVQASTGTVLALGNVSVRFDGGDKPAVNVYVTEDCSAYTCVADVWYTKGLY